MRKLGSISGGYLAISGGPAAQAGAHLSALKRPLPAAAGLAAAMGAPVRRKLRPLSGLREEKMSDPLMPQSMKRNLIIQASVPPAEHPPPGTLKTASLRMLLHPIGQEARSFPLGPPGHFAFKRARRGKTEQTSAWQTARRRRRSLPSAVRQTILQKQSKNAALPHKKPCKNRPPAANPAGKAGVPKSAGRFCGPRPRPPLPRRAETAVRGRGICPAASVFGEKRLTIKLACANLQSVVR